MNPEQNPSVATDGECICSRTNDDAGCSACDTSPLEYWCEVCQQNVPEKRCHLCGLKARKMRQATRRGDVIG